MAKIVPRVAPVLATATLLLLAADKRGERETQRVLLTGDIYEPGFSRAHPELCPSQGALLRVLILVASAPSHETRRNAIRYTWGNFASRSDLAVAFVLGAPPPTLRRALDAEDMRYGDLVMSNSIDSYSNLTLKTLAMLEWADAYCPCAARLLKTDDDVFLNVPQLLQFVSSANHTTVTRTVWGKVHHNRLPIRQVQHKCYISPLQFPARVLPDYTAGAAYMLTADAVLPLLKVAMAEPYVRVEDVFVTGVLAAKAGLRLQHVPGFNNAMKAHAYSMVCVIAVRNVTYHKQLYLWRALTGSRIKC